MLVCVTLKIEFNTEASFLIPLSEDESTVINNTGVWSTGYPVHPYYSKLTPDQVYCCRAAVKLPDAVHSGVDTMTANSNTDQICWYRCEASEEAIQSLMSGDGRAIKSDRQCVPQLDLPSHRRFYQNVTELQNVPISMAVFIARPIK